jgi:hypothetical protein
MGVAMREGKSRAHLVVLAAVLARAAAAAEDTPRLDLVWVDPVQVAAGIYPALAAESRSVLAPLGAEVAWTAAPKGAVMGPESLVVIAIPTPTRGRGSERHVMGATRTTADGAPGVWVFPDQVAWALGLDLARRSSWGMIAEAHFARAVARVASHEVVHALGATAHVRGGLMSAALGREALTSRVLRIDGATVSAVRRTFDRGTRTASRSSPGSVLREAPAVLAPELLASRGPSR